jgi:hypothetical protein
MKVTHERATVEADDDITCEPAHHTAAIGTTSTYLKRIPTDSVGVPVSIHVILNGQKIALSIANNAPPESVINMARVHVGQNVEFAPPSPTAWVPNKIYHLRPTSPAPATRKFTRREDLNFTHSGSRKYRISRCECYDSSSSGHARCCQCLMAYG